MRPTPARELAAFVVFGTALVAACQGRADRQANRATGYVEATDVRVAPKSAGACSRSDSPKAIASPPARCSRASTRPTSRSPCGARRPSASRSTRSSRLLQAGSRQEDIRQAASQFAVVASGRQGRAGRARRRLGRCRSLRVAPARQRRLGQAARRCGDAAGCGGAPGSERRRIAPRRRPTALARLRAGARPQEIEAARARVAAADAQIASLQKNLARRRRQGPGRRHRHVEADRSRRDGRAARADRRHHRSRSRLGERLRRRAAGAAAQDRTGGRR